MKVDEDNRSDTLGTPSEQEPKEVSQSFWLREHGPIAYGVYKNVWDEFYTWETEDCQNILNNLARPYKPKPLRHPEPHMHPETKTYTPSNPDSQSCKIMDFDTDGSKVRISHLRTDPTVVGGDNSVTLDPYPRYTSCTPASHNFLIGDHKMDIRARFVPYADDPEFHEKYPGYLEQFEDFAWQREFIDPDFEMIELEAARRLHFAHNYTLQEIESFAMFSNPLRTSNNQGLIWYASQRDPIVWSGSSLSDLPLLPTTNVDPGLSLYDEVTRDLINFCPRLSCALTFCKAHDKAKPIIAPKATTTTERMLSGKRNPCNRECYKTVDRDDAKKVNDHWDDADRSLFNSVIKLAPDTYPCDLAVICRKPCFEMYIERLNVLPEDQIETEKLEEKCPNISFVVPRNLPEPCSHEGPCSRANDCKCYIEKYNCQRSCRCTRKCRIRRKGCNCYSKITKGKNCVKGNSTLCPCAEQSMECDPELCKGCNALLVDQALKLDARHGKCQNMGLQRGNFARILIKPSKYGLGAFATKAIKPGAYISEYVGELMNDAASQALESLKDHAGFNYAFEYGTHELLDSWHIGNETRYLNDSKPNDPNCVADFMTVDSDPRLVIKTSRKIAPGEELFLDYGERYWNKNWSESQGKQTEE